MLGIELVTDRHNKTPAKDETVHVMNQMKGAYLYLARGVILHIQISKYPATINYCYQ